MSARIRALLVAAGSLVAVSTSAHHSTAVYSTEAIPLEGEIVEVEWVNPHIRFRLRTTGPDGEEQIWSLEGGSLMTLQRSGLTREHLHEGDRVKVAARVSKRDPLLAWSTNLLLPDGRELQLATGAPAYFTDEARLVKGSERVAADTIRADLGIFRVWSVPNPNPVFRALASLPFTAAAVAARAEFDLYDNFATRCEPEGMPRIMFNPHPFEFIDHGTSITLRTELYDTERSIHLDRAEPPTGEAASRLGYSVGRWDGGVLVVTTSLVSWPYFDNAGTPQSSAVRILERYTPSEDQSRLDFQVTVTDPATFTAPAVLEGYWLALGGTIPRYDCQPTR